MATRQKRTDVPVQKAQMDTPERFKLSETGYVGLRIFDGVSKDELKKELNFPNNIKVFKEMSYHSSVNSSLTLFDSIISKATWTFKPPVDATEEEKRQCKLVESMMLDMEHSWAEFIRDVLSMNIFGFSVHEKVYRRRLTSNGSMFNDGVIGWKKLPIRAQETIQKFVFSADGNEIIGVKQDISGVTDTYNRYTERSSHEVVLARQKILLFRAGRHRGDPFGKSPLRDAYLAWRFLTALEDLEAVGVSKDLNGLPVLMLPPQYLSADATPEQKAIKDYYERCMANLQMNEQSAMILPNAYDPDSKKPLFSLELLSVDGKKAFDISKIKEYYRNLIYTSLFSDILQMGQSATGSFALGSIKNSLSGAAAEGMIKIICEVLNQDLIKQTYELNGWDVSRRGTLDYDNLEDADLETISKFWQRVTSVGLVEKDREVLNAIRVAGGIDPLPANLPPQQDLLTPETSRSGDGMAKGSGNGTSDNAAGTDNSSDNLENAA
jgi:hypothetical protein